jgi:hypothetical protein
MRPVPKHFYLMFGQLPSSISDRALLALKEGDEAKFDKEVVNKLSPQEIFNSMMFTREAVKFACVKPAIVFDPKTDDEISPLQISEKWFRELSKTVMKEIGGQAEGLNSFRRFTEQPARSRANGSEFSPPAQRNRKSKK